MKRYRRRAAGLAEFPCRSAAEGWLRLRALLVWQTAARGAFDPRQHRHFLALRDSAGHRRHGGCFTDAADLTSPCSSLSFYELL